MPRLSSVVAEDVARRARDLDRYLEKIDGLHRQRALVDRDAERAYAGGYLEFHAYVERALERLFLGLLRRRLKSADGSVRPLIAVSSDRVASEIVAGGRRYVDWLPYKLHTTPRARAFFAGGRPFDRLDKGDLNSLDEGTAIRNALAHQSSAALRRFREKCVDNRSLPPTELRPAGYLRGTHTRGQTRMNYQLARAVLVVRKLAA